MKSRVQNNIPLNELVEQIRNGNRVLLAQAITLIESRLPEDRIRGQELIEALLPYTGHAVRVGITGVPGVGKSTFIEAFGKHLTSLSKKIAVLAIDPSSAKTKGSILGDKTRMEELAKDPNAFIRPTATNNALGGVADRTREAMLLCEAAGFDVVMIETVGVGQSEVMVKNMVDFFLLLMLAGAGDELQGIKKGIMEMADGIAITKVEHDNLKKAKQAQADLLHALHVFQPSDAQVKTSVLLTSALEKKGIDATWKMITDFMDATKENGYFQKNRQQQNLKWFHESIGHLIQEEIRSSKTVMKKITELEERIQNNKILPTGAAREVIRTFFSS